jgi:uncharacterized protein (DUF1697 family)
MAGFVTTYIALLRGINVGGHTVKMEQLRRLFEELGFEQVRSYIASGNLFFESDDTNVAALTTRIEQHLAADLGFEVPTFLRTVDELDTTLQGAPFTLDGPSPDERFCIVFTQAPIPDSVEVPSTSANGDMELIGVGDRAAYVVWHLKDGRPPSSNFAERTLPTPATTRFFHTSHNILEAARK